MAKFGCFIYIAHRTLITRKLKGLEDIISFTSVHWHLGDLGWRFATAEENLPGENTGPDPHHQGFEHLRQIYFDVDPEYKGRFTVPTLYDTKTKTIVSNEVCMKLTADEMDVKKKRLFRPGKAGRNDEICGADLGNFSHDRALRSFACFITNLTIC